MTSKFDAYDLLSILIPGTLLLGWGVVCFPQASGLKPEVALPEAFTVIVLTAFAVFIGHLVQSVASLVEPALFWSWGGRPSDRALKDGLTGYLPKDSSERIAKKLRAEVGDDASEHSLFLYAIQQTDGRDLGRARRFNSLYAYQRALFVLSVVCGVMLIAAMVWGRAAEWNWKQDIAAVVVVFLLIGLIWNRARQRACYYVREVMLTAERVLDDRNRKKE